MKIYRRFIRASKYADENDESILFDDSIMIDVEIDLGNIIASKSNHNESAFPGVEQFKTDVVNMLENEYHFDVIEDIYDGKKQKGYVSNRGDSISIYIDSYFDLSNAEYALKRLGVKEYNIPEPTKIYCFIHIRFSDHDLSDYGDKAHREFIEDNADKYTSNRQDVTHVMKDEVFTVPESLIWRYYNDALDDLRSQIETRTLHWLRRAEIYRRHK